MQRGRAGFSVALLLSLEPGVWPGAGSRPALAAAMAREGYLTLDSYNLFLYIYDLCCWRAGRAVAPRRASDGGHRCARVTITSSDTMAFCKR